MRDPNQRPAEGYSRYLTNHAEQYMGGGYTAYIVPFLTPQSSALFDRAPVDVDDLEDRRWML